MKGHWTMSPTIMFRDRVNVNANVSLIIWEKSWAVSCPSLASVFDQWLQLLFLELLTSQQQAERVSGTDLCSCTCCHSEILILFCSILFYSRLCPSTAGSSPPPESSNFLCPLLSLSIPLPVVPQCHLSNDVLVSQPVLHPLSANLCFY